MNEPKITVIIPTRERADVLRDAIRTVTSQDYDNLEIIVSDNDSRDDTKDIVHCIDDKRLRYLNPGRRLSMSEHWEYALSHVSAGWITIIGDDDGLLPNSVDAIAKIIRSTGVKAIRSRICSYSWPSVTGKAFGRLAVPLKVGLEIRECSPWLARVMSGHCSYFELPMLYNGGYVSVSVLDAIKSKTGCVYRSCIPDVYSAISIASVLDRYVYSHAPTAINGASRHSTGTSTFSTQVKHGTSPATRFASEDNLAFHKDIPLWVDGAYPASIQTLVYESYLQSSNLRSASPSPMHAKQLGIILATPLHHSDQIRKWGRIFAREHDLDFRRISSRSMITRLALNARQLTRLVADAFSTWSVGSAKQPITNVYDASLIAAQIVANPPGLARILGRLLARLLSTISRVKQN
jgi:glycosyltransferase involved in cell wall biosynthesis